MFGLVGNVQTSGHNMRNILFVGYVAVTLTAFGQTTTPLTRLTAKNAKLETVRYLGRHAIRLTMDGDAENGFAFLRDVDFQDGVIEADIALRLTTPKGVRNPGFVGIAFRARPDASHYELFYLRPGNAGAEDQAMRNHVVQYSSAPGFGWYELRRAWPWVYESHADLALEAWIKVKIEVAGRGAKLYLNGSEKPSLVVDGLKGEDLKGAVALWGYAGEESYFSNVRVTPAATVAAVQNGSDIAGSWDVKCTSDAGPLQGVMMLNREGSKVAGTWSGGLGDERTVSGAWRQGYVELSFVGEWPKDTGLGFGGPVTAFIAGWVDGDSGKGRMRVEGRSDGQWTATRKK